MRFPFFEFVTAVRVATALMFFTAAVGKMRSWGTFEGVVANYRLLPDALNRVVAWALPPVELLLGCALMLGAPSAETAAAALLCVFAAAMAINLQRGRTHIDCGCFDASLRQPLHWALVVRNALLALLLIVAARSRNVDDAADAMTLTMGVLAGAAFFMVVQCANIVTALPAKARSSRRRTM
jgi:uncharacterized membrane protein YphA (DoxX/SURF4 family)